MFQDLQDISDALKFKHSIGPKKAKIKFRRMFKVKKQSAFRKKWKDELERFDYVGCCSTGRCWEKFDHCDLQVPSFFLCLHLSSFLLSLYYLCQYHRSTYGQCEDQVSRKQYLLQQLYVMDQHLALMMIPVCYVFLISVFSCSRNLLTAVKGTPKARATRNAGCSLCNFIHTQH